MFRYEPPLFVCGLPRCQDSGIRDFSVSPAGAAGDACGTNQRSTQSPVAILACHSSRAAGRLFVGAWSDQNEA